MVELHEWFTEVLRTNGASVSKTPDGFFFLIDLLKALGGVHTNKQAHHILGRIIAEESMSKAAISTRTIGGKSVKLIHARDVIRIVFRIRKAREVGVAVLNAMQTRGMPLFVALTGF
jgi:hypothetical protein